MNPCRKQVSEIFVAELAVTYTVHITAGHGQANWSQKQATTAKVKLQYIQSTVNSWCTYFFQKLVLFLKNINACFIIRRWCKPRMLCSLIHIPYPDVCFKFHIFQEGHKNLRNLHCRFDTYYITSNQRWRFRQILWPS